MNEKFSLRILMRTTVLCVILLFLCSCKSSKEIEYYSEQENYITVSGIFSDMKYNEDCTTVYVEFSEVYPALDDTCFKIVGKNVAIVKSNKIVDELKVGDEVTFITAPKYFGDGYVMPIVAISVSEKTILNFEDGYENLLDWLSD